MMLTFSTDLNFLAKEICEKEKGKEQVNIAQVKQIVAVISRMLAANPGLGVCLVEYGFKLFREDEKFLEEKKKQKEEEEKKKQSSKQLKQFAKDFAKGCSKVKPIVLKKSVKKTKK